MTEIINLMTSLYVYKQSINRQFFIPFLNEKKIVPKRRTLETTFHVSANLKQDLRIYLPICTNKNQVNCVISWTMTGLLFVSFHTHRLVFSFQSSPLHLMVIIKNKIINCSLIQTNVIQILEKKKRKRGQQIGKN